MSRTWALLGACLILASCGGGASPVSAPSPSSPSPSAAEPTLPPNTIVASNNVFFPQRLTVSAGTTITWRNIGTYPHNVVSPDKLFNSHPQCAGGPVETVHSGCMKVGESFRYTFTKAGAFPFYCTIHAACDGRVCYGSMQGIVTVA